MQSICSWRGKNGRPSLPFFRIVANELLSGEQVPREPEPHLVMDSSEQAEAYAKASSSHGSMASVHLFHCRNICRVIRPGTVVLDLACGTADLLLQLATLNLETQFIGLDLSESMLELARERCAERQLENVRFLREDCRSLSSFADCSADVVTSTMAFHHLANTEDLFETFRQINRILRPKGAIYIADFGLLRSHESMRLLSRQYADREDPVFIDDYFNSLKAAFSVEELRSAAAMINKSPVVCSRSLFAPFMVLLRAGKESPLPKLTERALASRRRQLPLPYWRDYLLLRLLFLPKS